MGRKANPVVIGAFVVAAIVLAVAGILIFGSGRMFRDTSKFVCFFPGAVDGLAVGAPVRFKGVDIGTVTAIRIRIAADTRDLDAELVNKGIRIPVTIEIDHAKLAGQADDQINLETFRHLIDLGLRAQLNAQSLVTGLLFVQLDFHPEEPAELILPPGSNQLEIPTIPTTMEQVQTAAAAIIDKLEEIHLEDIIDSVNSAVKAIEEVVRDPQIKATIDSLPQLVANMNQTLASVREVAVGFNQNQGALFTSLRTTSEGATAALKQARDTFESVEVFIDPNSALAAQLATTMKEVSTAARSVRLLADYLERNPAALLRGKEVNEK